MILGDVVGPTGRKAIKDKYSINAILEHYN